MIIIKRFFEEVTFLGGILFYSLFIFWFLSKRQYNLVLILCFGLSIIYLATLVIRFFHFKPRPKRIRYNNFLEKIDASSFPSIHSARATFLFLFLFLFFIDSYVLLFLIFFLSIFVLYSRIYLMKHYWEDILGGVVLGAIAFIFSYLLNAAGYKVLLSL